MSEEEALELAMKLSVEEFQKSRKGEVRLESSFSKGRYTLQINTLDQFHCTFTEAIEQYKCPTAICGLMVSISIQDFNT